VSDQPVFQSHTERNIRSLRTATAVAYLVAFSLLALTVGFGIWKIQSAHQHLEQVMARHNQKVRLITETQVASYRRADTVQLLILETDPFEQDEIFMAYLKSGFQVGDGRNRIRALLSSDREKAILEQQDTIIAEAVELHETIADLARSGQHEQARAIFMDRVAALHEVGHATFETLRNLQTQAAEHAIGAANAAYRKTLRNSIIAMLISLIVSITIGLLMHRASGRITSRLRDNVGNLRHMALHDSLTGLLNRTAITQMIEQQLRKEDSFALLYMDLDGFKQVNDLHGHDLGDNFLMMAAARIRARLRGIDIVARLGGDEFVALMQGISSTEECEHVARHIIEAFELPFVHRQVRTEIGVSIGVAIAPTNGRTAAQLIDAADRAMYRAKKRGRNCYEIHPQQIELVLHEGAAG
jgi:diguanylate cyclase (GGDEF)-like protein